MILDHLTDLELAILQHELRTYPEDRLELEEVLQELQRRAKAKAAETKAPAPLE
jgi:hypothetical protein